MLGHLSSWYNVLNLVCFSWSIWKSTADGFWTSQEWWSFLFVWIVSDGSCKGHYSLLVCGAALEGLLMIRLSPISSAGYGWLLKFTQCNRLTKCSHRVLPDLLLPTAFWKCLVLRNCKIFPWLSFQYRMWTSNRHGLQAQTATCFVCFQEEDTTDHILVHFYAHRVWYNCFCVKKIQVAIPQVNVKWRTGGSRVEYSSVRSRERSLIPWWS
jgi:hypothetical protein